MKQKTLLKSNIKNIVKVIIGEKERKRRRKRRQRKPKIIQQSQQVSSGMNLGAVASAGQSVLNTITQKQTEALININKKLQEFERVKQSSSRLYQNPIKVGLGDYAIGHHNKSTSTEPQIQSNITGSQNQSLTDKQEEGDTDRLQQPSLLSKKGDPETDMGVYDPPIRDDPAIGVYQGGRDLVSEGGRDLERQIIGNSLSSSISSTSLSTGGGGGGGGGGGIMGEAFVSNPSQTGLAYSLVQVAEPAQETQAISGIIKTRDQEINDLKTQKLPQLMAIILSEDIQYIDLVGQSTASGNFYLKGNSKETRQSNKQKLIDRIVEKKFR